MFLYKVYPDPWEDLINKSPIKFSPMVLVDLLSDLFGASGYISMTVSTLEARQKPEAIRWLGFRIFGLRFKL